MSEDKRIHLAETLTSLSNEDKVWVINFLVQGMLSLPAKKKAKRDRRDDFNEEQWEEYFDHQPAVPLPDTTPTKDVVAVSSGRSIKQMEKWL